MNFSRSAGTKEKHISTWTTFPKKRYVCEFQYGLVLKFIAVKDAMKIQDATAAVAKEWDKLKNRCASHLKKSETQVRSGWFSMRRRTGDLFISDSSWTSAI